MKIKNIIYILVLALFSCIPEQELKMNNIDFTNGYFIECYCQPGEKYTLSAMYLMPVNEDIDPIYAYDLDVKVYNNSMIELQAGRHEMPGSQFIYNYGSKISLEKSLSDTLYLEVTTPQNEKITAKTVIPSEVVIDSYEITDKEISVSFFTSENPDQNYYIFTAQLQDKRGELLQKEYIFVNFNHYSNVSLVNKTIESAYGKSAEKIILTVMRITEECYKYQVSLYEANSASQGSITTPLPLAGNISGAYGIFTCYTMDRRYIVNE